MDCNQFKRKMDTSSSSQDDGQQIMGDDKPTIQKVIKKQWPQIQHEDTKGRVLIIYNTEEQKPYCDSNQMLSQSGKSSGFSSQSRPSIYDESERRQPYDNEHRFRKNYRHFKQKKINFEYFNPQRYQNHNQREHYVNYNGRHQNYQYNRRHDQRWHNHRDQQTRNYHQGNRRNQQYYYDERQIYPRENQYNHGCRHQQRPIQNCHQRQRYGQRPYYHREEQRRHDQRNENQRYYEQQRNHNTRIYQKKQKQEQKKQNYNNRVGREKKQIQLIKRDFSEKVVVNNKQQTQKQRSFKNNLNQKPQISKKQSSCQALVEKQKIERKSPVGEQLQTSIKKQNHVNSIQNKRLQFSQQQSRINQGHSHIQLSQSIKQKVSQTQIKQTEDDSSNWDASSEDSQDDSQKNDAYAQSFECHEISLQLPAEILYSHQNQSNMEEDLFIIEALSPQIKHSSKSQETKVVVDSKMKIKQNTKQEKEYDQGLFKEEQLKILQKMFDTLLVDERSVFIELKIKTSNVSCYKIKSVSSEVFNLKSTKIDEIKNHPFILIKQSQKFVPRDPQPFSRNKQNYLNSNDKIQSKISKLILAEIRNPIYLLQHKNQFKSVEEKLILKKIQKNKQEIQNINNLISIDEINLKCSSCYTKKRFMWTNQIIPHQCKAQCANFLRFQIQNMHMC